MFRSDGAPMNPPQYWNRGFSCLGVPIVGQYDYLVGLTLLADKYFDDDRISKSFNLLMDQQNDDGTWEFGIFGTRNDGCAL